MNNSMIFDVSPEQLMFAMRSELEARRYYEMLVEMTPCEFEANIIRHFFSDEAKHYNNMKLLYRSATGIDPAIPASKDPNINSYIEGIEQALLDEMDSYELYRNIYLASNNPIIKRVFFEAFTDESEHAIKLNYLFAKNK